MRARLAFAIGLVLVCVTTAGGARVLWRKVVAPRGPGPGGARAADAADGDRPAGAAVGRAVAARRARGRAAAAATHADGRTGDGTASRFASAEAARGATGARGRAPIQRAPLAPVEPAARRSRGRRSRAAAPQRPPRRRSSPRRWSIFASDTIARAALATLDRYAREFPHGVLETEALRTRVEAVIQLGDLKTALRILDGKVASTEALGADLTLTRAELRAAAGRFREALSDFTEVVDGAAGRSSAAGMSGRCTVAPICLGRLAQDESRARRSARVPEAVSGGAVRARGGTPAGGRGAVAATVT